MKMTERQAGKIAHELRGDEAKRYLDEETRAKLLSLAESLAMGSYVASDVIEYLIEINDWLKDGHEIEAPRLVAVLKNQLNQL